MRRIIPGLRKKVCLTCVNPQLRKFSRTRGIICLRARHLLICTLRKAPMHLTARFQRKETTMKTFIAAGLSALTLVACASDPAPRPAANAYAEGYTERALSANRYVIDYRMDGSDYQRAFDLALWRAAQITLQHGYTVFEVVNRDSATEQGARSTTSFSSQHGVAYVRSCGLVSCTTTARPVSWHGVQVAADGRRASRTVSLEIILQHSLPANAPNRYVAAEIIRSLERH